MKSNFLNQHFRIVPNPFDAGAMDCLCKCPKYYFTEKDKVSYRLSALVAERPDNPGTSFSLSRVERDTNPNPGSTAGAAPIGLVEGMSIATLEFNVTGSTFKTVYDPILFTTTIADDGSVYAPAEPIPSISLGVITNFAESAIPVGIGVEIPNTVAAGQQVGYYDGVNIVYMPLGKIRMMHSALNTIELFLEPITAGDLIPADYVFFTNANVQFDFLGGGVFYDYTVRSLADFPAKGDTSIELFYSTDGIGNTNQFTETRTPEQWNAGVLMLSLPSAEDPTVNGWPEAVQIIAEYLAGGFSDRFTYRSDKPFIPIGFADLSDYDTANPFNPVVRKWTYNIADSIANKAAIQDFIIACQIAASIEPGTAVEVFDTLYTSFVNDNWYAYFENAVKQLVGNRFIFTTPGMTQETFTAASEAVQAMITDLTTKTQVYDMAQRLFNSLDLNLLLPSGLYGIGSDDSYTTAFDDYKTAESHYPYLVVLQILP